MVTAMISRGALDILIVRAAHTKIVTRPTVSAQLQLIFAAHPLGDFATTSLVVKVISSRRSKMRARQQHRTGVSTGRNPWAGADCRGTPRRRQRVRFQLAPQGYHFPAGHIVKVEVTANDTPYMQKSNIPARVSVTRLKLTLPLYQDTSE